MSALRLSDRSRKFITLGALGLGAAITIGYTAFSLSQPRDKTAVLRCFFDSKQPGGQKIQVDTDLSVAEAKAISPSPNCQALVCDTSFSRPLSNCAPVDESGLQAAAKTEKGLEGRKSSLGVVAGLVALIAGGVGLASIFRRVMRSLRIRTAISRQSEELGREIGDEVTRDIFGKDDHSDA